MFPVHKPISLPLAFSLAPSTENHRKKRCLIHAHKIPQNRNGESFYFQKFQCLFEIFAFLSQESENSQLNYQLYGLGSTVFSTKFSL